MIEEEASIPELGKHVERVAAGETMDQQMLISVPDAEARMTVALALPVRRERTMAQPGIATPASAKGVGNC